MYCYVRVKCLLLTIVTHATRNIFASFIINAFDLNRGGNRLQKSALTLRRFACNKTYLREISRGI